MPAHAHVHVGTMHVHVHSHARLKVEGPGGGRHARRMERTVQGAAAGRGGMQRGGGAMTRTRVHTFCMHTFPDTPRHQSKHTLTMHACELLHKWGGAAMVCHTGSWIVPGLTAAEWLWTPNPNVCGRRRNPCCATDCVARVLTVANNAGPAGHVPPPTSAGEHDHRPSASPPLQLSPVQTHTPGQRLLRAPHRAVVISAAAPLRHWGAGVSGSTGRKNRRRVR
eukprot:365103-Chlamydomonas_euryale.AAC.3